jgi:hypothetical protein
MLCNKNIAHAVQVLDLNHLGFLLCHTLECYAAVLVVIFLKQHLHRGAGNPQIAYDNEFAKTWHELAKIQRRCGDARTRHDEFDG